MTNLQHAFEPLDNVRTLPVRWEMNQSDYDKLKIGNDESKNHWHCIMQNNTVHIYKGFNGIEHFRFNVHTQEEGKYLVESIETHDITDFSEKAIREGRSGQELDEHLSKNNSSIVDEVSSMLSYFFGIKVGA
jgi:hypothetical protein